MVPRIPRTLGALFISASLLVIAAPVQAYGGNDECAGGIDAGNGPSAMSDLVVFAGCSGQFYQPPGNSTGHGPKDFRDFYKIRVDGVGVETRIQFQLCNQSDMYLYASFQWRNNVGSRTVLVQGPVAPHSCLLDGITTYTGYHKPGEWELWIEAITEMPNNSSHPYWVYAQPLFR
jgi:hypothetical protein